MGLLLPGNLKFKSFNGLFEEKRFYFLNSFCVGYMLKFLFYVFIG